MALTPNKLAYAIATDAVSTCTLDPTPASSSDLNTGTDNTKPVTALALAGSDYLKSGDDATLGEVTATLVEAGTVTVISTLTIQGATFILSSLLVTIGANDSGGTGFRALVVPNE